MEFKFNAEPLLKGVCAPLPSARDESGNFDPASQERLLAWVTRSGSGVHAVLSSPGLEPGLIKRQANEACHFVGAQAQHWAGVSAESVEELLQNLEQALKLGVSTAVLDPLAVKDSPDPSSLFHRHILPLFERLGKGLAIVIEDSGSERRIRTQDLKELARLEILRGVSVTASPKVVGNYLKGARHYKARHEFGVFLGNAELIFSLFMPAQGSLKGIRGRWERLWLGSELPHGIAPLSANLFPEAWRQAWAAAQAGDAVRMAAFEDAFQGLAFPFDPMACVRAALAEEGVLSSDQGPLRLNDAQRQEWLFEYFSTKKELGKLLKGQAAPQLKPAPGGKTALAPASFDLVGIGGVVLDEFRRSAKLAGAESKEKVLGAAQQRPGGVMLNQLSWASSLGLQSALFGYLGADANGDWLRGQIRERGIEDAWLLPSTQPTEIARIFVDSKGERAIYLEPGAGMKTGPKDLAPFEELISKSRMLSTEISLLPLATVLALQAMAKRQGKALALDLDIPASQATGKGGLGTAAELTKILRQADYLKSSVAFARQLAPGVKASSLAAALHKKYKKAKGHWVALTDQARGCQVSDGVKSFRVPASKGVKVADSTGCGDAFMAGMLAGTLLKLDLRSSAALANACGAACASLLGAAAPESGARELVLKYFKGKLGLLPARQALEPTGLGRGSSFMLTALKELEKLSRRPSKDAFEAARRLILDAEAKGKRLHITGVGKPEYVARYVASSYSSTGSPAFFLHATEAGHGASGQVSAGDVVIAISNSGETEELKSAVSTVKKNGAKVIGVSGKYKSWLERQSDSFLFAGVEQEGDALNLAPRASVLAELLVLSALGVALQEEKNFTADDFRSFHPGGSLGRKN